MTPDLGPNIKAKKKKQKNLIHWDLTPTPYEEPKFELGLDSDF